MHTIIHIQKWICAQWNWPSETKPNTENCEVCSCVCIALCTIVAHNIAENRPDSFPSYPRDNHHCSDVVYLREGEKLYKRHDETILHCSPNLALNKSVGTKANILFAVFGATEVDRLSITRCYAGHCVQLLVDTVGNDFMALKLKSRWDGFFGGREFKVTPTKPGLLEKKRSIRHIKYSLYWWVCVIPGTHR